MEGTYAHRSGLMGIARLDPGTDVDLCAIVHSVSRLYESLQDEVVSAVYQAPAYR